MDHWDDPALEPEDLVVCSGVIALAGNGHLWREPVDGSLGLVDKRRKLREIVAPAGRDVLG